MKTLSSTYTHGLGLLTRRVRDAMWQRMEQEMAADGYDLNYSQFITLRALSEGPTCPSELAHIAELHPSAMTRLIDKLEASNLITRTQDTVDRRVSLIHLSEEGKRVWNEVYQCGQRVLAITSDGFTQAEYDQLISLLTRVHINLTACKP